MLQIIKFAQILFWPSFVLPRCILHDQWQISNEFSDEVNFPLFVFIFPPAVGKVRRHLKGGVELKRVGHNQRNKRTSFNYKTIFC